MRELSDFELAQRRLEDRQRKQNFIYMWFAVWTFVGVLGVSTGCQAITCFLLPLAIIFGLVRWVKNMELDPDSARYLSNVEQVEQEMSWLFGTEWEEIAGPETYAFARSRMRDRSNNRWLLLAHVLIFIPANYIIILIGFAGIRSNSPGMTAMLVVSALWLLFLLRHALNAYPTKKALARRERKVGEALILEMEHLHPEKLKHKEKPKRGLSYTFGDDGEIIELEEDSELSDEKPKQARNEST